MAKDYSQVNFRIPTQLKEKVEASASENEQSITAELVSRLEKSFEQTSQDKELSELKNELEQLNQTVKILSKTLSSFIERTK